MPTNFAGRLRPIPGVDSRFICYLMASLYSDGRTTAAIKQTTGIQNLDLEALLDNQVKIASEGGQRVIADFLDTETTRIDALIAKKRLLLSVIEQRARVLSEQIIWSDPAEPVPLMYRTMRGRPIMYGIVLPGPDVPEGVPIVKGGDVAAGRVTPSQLNKTTFEIEAPYARARLQEGDLLFTIRGGIQDS